MKVSLTPLLENSGLPCIAHTPHNRKFCSIESVLMVAGFVNDGSGVSPLHAADHTICSPHESARPHYIRRDHEPDIHRVRHSHYKRDHPYRPIRGLLHSKGNGWTGCNHLPHYWTGRVPGVSPRIFERSLKPRWVAQCAYAQARKHPFFQPGDKHISHPANTKPPAIQLGVIGGGGGI